MAIEATGKSRLYAKIAAVAANIQRVEKDGYNPQLKYKYAKPETIMAALKPLLAEQGLAILPMCVGVTKEDTGGKTSSGSAKVNTRVDMTYIIACGDTGETVSLTWYGEGEDWSDKGIAKAKTIALRTFLIQLFQIPTGDEDLDPDRGQDEQPQRQQPFKQPQRPAPPAPKSANNGARYEEPPLDEPSVKKAPTKEVLINRIRKLWNEYRALGYFIPPALLTGDLEKMTIDELIDLGKRTSASLTEMRDKATLPPVDAPKKAA